MKIAERENSENNGICDEITQLIREKTRDGTNLFICSPYVVRVKITEIEEGKDIDFIVAPIDLINGFLLHPKSPIRFRKSVDQGWQLFIKYTEYRGGGYGDKEREIDKDEINSDLDLLVKMIKNCRPLRW